jgi:hypothetical protein
MIATSALLQIAMDTEEDTMDRGQRHPTMSPMMTEWQTIQPRSAEEFTPGEMHGPTEMD